MPLMNRIMIIMSVLIIMEFIVLFPTVQAVSITIDTEKEVYHYGDYLVFTVDVSEITGDTAILHIIDEAGKSSSAVPIAISEMKTVVPSPFPFESIVYPEGTYTLNIEYSGASDTAEFELIDVGNIVIPFWIKQLATDWTGGLISNNEFGLGIERLIKENIIVIPEFQSQENHDIKIPQWVKTTTAWWNDGMIPDESYAKSLEYLIKKGIIVV